MNQSMDAKPSSSEQVPGAAPWRHCCENYTRTACQTRRQRAAFPERSPKNSAFPVSLSNAEQPPNPNVRPSSRPPHALCRREPWLEQGKGRQTLLPLLSLTHPSHARSPAAAAPAGLHAPAPGQCRTPTGERQPGATGSWATPSWLNPVAALQLPRPGAGGAERHLHASSCTARPGGGRRPGPGALVDGPPRWVKMNVDIYSVLPHIKHFSKCFTSVNWCILVSIVYTSTHFTARTPRHWEFG